MSTTLKVLGRTVAALAAMSGPKCHPCAIAVAGVIALASTIPEARAEGPLPDLGDVVKVQPAKPSASGAPISQANVARILGGLTGYAVAAVAGGNTAVKVIATGAGAYLGGRAVGDGLLSGQRLGLKVPAKPLPDDLRTPLAGLFVEAAARRVVAQAALAARERAELSSVTAPKNRAAYQAYNTARARHDAAMQRLRLAMAEASAAVQVMQRQGYDVGIYSASLRELSAPVTKDHIKSFDSPAVAARAAEIERDPGVNESLSTLGEHQRAQASKREGAHVEARRHVSRGG